MSDEKKLKEYYNNLSNIFRIVNSTTNKETALLNPQGMIIRGLNIQLPKYFITHKEKYNIEQNKYNIYHSVTHYKNLPLFSYNKEIRKKQYNIWTNNKTYKQHITNYDFYIDFDNHEGDNFELVRQECKTISDYFNKKRIKHEIILSGSGLHIKSELKKSDQNPEKARELHDYLKNKFWLTTTDSSIYRWQALIKVPYSVDVKTMRVCVKIRKEDLETFNPEDHYINNYIKK